MLVQYVVRTRPKHQVVAHGQSYIARQVASKKLKRSIHDISLSHMLQVEEDLGLDLQYNFLDSGDKRRKTADEKGN